MFMKTFEDFSPFWNTGKINKQIDRVCASQGDYVAKQKVTLWNYGNGGTTLIPYNVPEKVELEVML